MGGPFVFRPDNLVRLVEPMTGADHARYARPPVLPLPRSEESAHFRRNQRKRSPSPQPSPPGEGEARTVPGNFHALWCGTASWGLTSAAMNRNKFKGAICAKGSAQ